MSRSLARGGKNANCDIDLSPTYLHEKFSVSSLLFPEEKVEGMDKNDSDINLGVQAGTVYGKSWVRGSGKPISKTVQRVL